MNSFTIDPTFQSNGQHTKSGGETIYCHTTKLVAHTLTMQTAPWLCKKSFFFCLSLAEVLLPFHNAPQWNIFIHEHFKEMLSTPLDDHEENVIWKWTFARLLLFYGNIRHNLRFTDACSRCPQNRKFGNNTILQSFTCTDFLWSASGCTCSTLFFLVQPTELLICGVVVAFLVVKAPH